MKLISLFQVTQLNKNKITFVSKNRSYSYQEIFNCIVQMIYILKSRDFKKGQRVVVISDQDENAVFFILAASVMGLQIIMPYNLQDTAFAEWADIIKSSNPNHIVYLKKNTDSITNLQKISNVITRVRLTNSNLLKATRYKLTTQSSDSIENFLVLFTSGTTGKPKAISISENLICRRIINVSSILKFNSDAKIFMSGLINNTTGIIFSLGALLHQATLFFPCDRNVENWPSEVKEKKITHIMLRPISMKKFVESAQKSNLILTDMRVVAYGAAPLSKNILQQGRTLMPCEWVQGYGLSETFGPFCWLTEEDHKNNLYEKLIYCIGKPDGTLEVSLYFKEQHATKVGEIIVRGPCIMEGYYNTGINKVNKINGWFHTGDYAELTGDGYFILKGRASNTILTKNGHCIYPEEVEGIISEVLGVDEVVLLGYPIENALENIVIVCISGPLVQYHTTYIQNIIAKKISEKLSREKWPEYIYTSKVPFPKSQNDKILKSEVFNLIKFSDLIGLNVNKGELVI